MEWSLTGLPLPIVLRPPLPWTDDEILELSRKNRALRIERNAQGEITVMTPVGGEGGNWEATVIRKLGSWADEDDRGLVFSSNSGFNLPDGSILSPDASWISFERWEALTPEQRRKYPPLCPDFVIEILSSTDPLPILRAKMETWIANGAKLAWMLDPYAGILTIYRPDREPEVLLRPDVVEGEGPVAGFRLATSKLWAS